MISKFKNILRFLWHALYYVVAPSKVVDFALRCKQVAESIDLDRWPDGRYGKVRMKLHLSLCQACKNYFDANEALKRVARELVLGRVDQIKLEQLNAELLQRFGKK